MKVKEMTSKKNFHLTDEMAKASLQGKTIKVNEDNSIEIVEEDCKDINELNNYCYFCDFHEIKPHQHHIIRKCDDGKDTQINKLPLCANHHELIHRRVYVLGHNPRYGIYYLINRKTREITYPHKRQINKFRKLPLSSINSSKNIKVDGDLNKKACIKIENMYRSNGRRKN